MKLISQFTNRYDNIVYSVYELSNGIKLIHLQNPTDIDFNFSITVQAGAVYEPQEKVPQGTAHFLEHMLFNPNSYYRDKNSIFRFEEGSKERPKIYVNATTTRKNIYFSAGSNHGAKFRVLERVGNMIDFPKEKFGRYFEKEREVILAERSKRPKLEKDMYVQSLKFLLEKDSKEFTTNIIGEEKDIRKIGIEDLYKYFNSRFTTGNTIFSIQEKGALDTRTEKVLESISKRFVVGERSSFRNYSLRNELKYGAFKDEYANGITVYLFHFGRESGIIDYRKDVIREISSRIVRKFGFDFLREKQGLIYDLSTFDSKGIGYFNSIRGIRFVTEDSKLEKMIVSLRNMMERDIFKYLKSKNGKASFEDILSTFIYPRNKQYNEWLAEDCTSTLLETGEAFNENLYIDEGKKIVLSDVVKYLKKQFSIPPHIWIESAYEEGKIVERVKKFWK